MTSLGFTVNTLAFCLCCLTCQAAVSRNGVAHHLQLNHKASNLVIDVPTLNQVLDMLHVCESFPIMDNEISREPFDGIAIEQGYQCPYCFHCLLQLQSLQRHYRTLHIDLPQLPNLSSKPMQTFSRSKRHMAYFPVTSLTEMPESFLTWKDAIIEEYTCALNQTGTLSNTASLNPRAISPWLMKTRWHEYIPESLMPLCQSLVQPPRNSIFNHLRDSIFHYFNEATHLIESTDDLILQILNTPHPEAT